MKIKIYPKISESCIKSSIGGDIFASIIIVNIIKDPAYFFTVEIDDCGNDMNSQFLNYYKYRYFESDEFDRIKFNEEASKFLIQNNENYIKFFRNLSFILQLPTVDKYIIDEKTLCFALDVVKEFENKNTTVKIHKGSPYHMLGISYISKGEILKGFLLVHQALTEDIRIGHKNGAALPLLTLDSQNAKAGKTLLIEAEKFINEKLTKYSAKYSVLKKGNLTFNDFRSKFLVREDIQDIVFQFVYTAFRLKEMVDIDKELMQNDFAALSQKDIIFDFCTIIENIIKTQNKYPNKNLSEQTLSPLLEFLSKKASLIIHEKDSKGFNSLNKINGLSNKDFHNALGRLLNSNYKSCHKEWCSFSLGFANKTAIDEDLLITFILRNSVHEIKSWPIIYQNFETIIERILNSLFFSIEELYI
jgi:hypothetical protein